MLAVCTCGKDHDKKFLVWLVASASDPNTQQPSDPNTQQPASQPATWQANKAAAAAESRMITCVWSLLVPDLVMLLVVVVVVIIVTSIFVNCHQSDIWLAVSVTVALWHSCCCCCCCCGIYNDSFLSLLSACSSCMYFVFLLLLLLGVVTCVVVVWNLSTSPSSLRIPASSQHLLKISTVNSWPFFPPL